MPKKFQGTNTKAVEARARKAAQQAEKQDLKKKQEEDLYWQDDHKINLRKQNRKEIQEKKKLETLNKKKELAELYEAEQSNLGKSAKPAPTKVSRADIEAQKQKEKAEKLVDEKRVSLEDVLEENINQTVANSLTNADAVEARSVSDAISALSVKEELDRHPERRLKASFKKFEEEYMPKLKAENPNLKLSQLRQTLRKMWQKSPENPMNQKSMSYNANK
uniref:Coiled-coil domain-containing protein n=1 Tax=Ciona intestinalis TaxID=7719 RepID=H2XNC6_CIOIN